MDPILSHRLYPSNSLNSLQEKEEKSNESLPTSPEKTTQNATSDLSSLSAPAPAQKEPDNLPNVAREVRNNFLVRAAGALIKYGLSVPEIRAMVLLLNQERYGQGRHPNGPLSVEELERLVFKNLQKWEGRMRKEPHAANIASLTSLMVREVPEPAWIVPGLLVEGLTILAGKPKVGKSWLILGLALSVAGGYPALGRSLEEQHGVLYLGLEDSESRLKQRAIKLLDGRPTPEGFNYQTAWEPLAVAGLEELRAWLDAQPNTRLVIIDTLAKVRTPTPGTSSIYQEDYALMGRLQELASEYHIALIVVHHTRKMESSDAFDTISGSTGLTGAADTSMVLTRERNQQEATLHITGRDIEEQELALHFTPDTGAWTLTGTSVEHQLSQARQEILDLLREHEQMTPAEIAQALGKTPDTIRKNLYRMASDWLVTKKTSGHYTLNPAFLQEDLGWEDL